MGKRRFKTITVNVGRTIARCARIGNKFVPEGINVSSNLVLVKISF